MEVYFWIFSHVVLPLMPIVINLTLLKLLNISEEWYQVLKDGKLFIFSSTLSGSSISLRFFQGSPNNDLESVCFSLLLINILVSSALFSIGNYVKLRQEEEEIDLQFLAIASIGCSLLAILCSYLISGVV
ncbi:MAG: hypothetical protein AB4352_18285 [Hormoscilla sp.]